MVDPQECPQAALATANRILAREGVLDAFGHISLRHPADPSRFYLARSMAPAHVTEGDILEFDSSSRPVAPFDGTPHSERVIHGAVFNARPDATAICRYRSPAMLPFCLTDLKLRMFLSATAGGGKAAGSVRARSSLAAGSGFEANIDSAAQQIPKTAMLQ